MIHEMIHEMAIRQTESLPADQTYIESVSSYICARAHRDIANNIICTQSYLLAECDRGHLCKYQFKKVLKGAEPARCPECKISSINAQNAIRLTNIHKLFERLFNVPFTRDTKSVWSSPHGLVKFRVDLPICRCDAGETLMFSVGKLSLAPLESFIIKSAEPFMKKRGLPTVLAAKPIKKEPSRVWPAPPRPIATRQVPDAFDGTGYADGQKIIRDCRWY